MSVCRYPPEVLGHDGSRQVGAKAILGIYMQLQQPFNHRALAVSVLGNQGHIGDRQIDRYSDSHLSTAGRRQGALIEIHPFSLHHFFFLPVIYPGFGSLFCNPLSLPCLVRYLTYSQMKPAQIHFPRPPVSLTITRTQVNEW